MKVNRKKKYKGESLKDMLNVIRSAKQILADKRGRLFAKWK